MRAFFTAIAPVVPVALALFTWAAATSAQAQSLLHMVESATGYDAAWRAASAAQQASQHRSAQARAPLLPQVGVGAELARGYTRLHPPGASHAGAQAQWALQASQTLYRPAQKITFAQSQLAARQAAHQLDATAQELIVRIAQAYFNALAAQDALRFVQAQKAAVQEQLAAAERNFEVGNATITDTREAQARFDLIRAQEIAAANDWQVKKLALEQATGLHQARPWPLREPVQLPTLEPREAQAWVEQALAHQPHIQQARLGLEMAQLETEKARAGHQPTVDLKASVTGSHTPDGSAIAPHLRRSQQAQVGVALNLPLFAGFAVQSRVQESLALQEQARAQLDGARRHSEQAVREAFYGLQSGLSQVQALQAAEASSLSALEANQLGYQVGVRINIDVLNAQSQLFQTRRELAQARYQVLMGHLRLAQASGLLDWQALRRINALLAEPDSHQP
ncbi:channel protein TolC [Comamonadaceae bacterium OH3737_COT-264]|nr:channel protein TolC [Comamonadaceae bacterium OH3737_COT-264]